MGVLSPADGQGPLAGTLVAPKRFWCVANFSHFVRPGWRLMQIDGVGPASPGFVNPERDGFVIVVANPNATPHQAAYDFGNLAMGPIEAYATTADRNLDRVPSPAIQSHRFDATLPPMSVTTFVGKVTR